MHINWKLSVVFIAVFAISAAAQSIQCPQMPPGFLCITQEAGNRAAQLAREAAAKDAKIIALEESLTLKDVSIKEIQDTAAKNIADLKDANTKVLISLSASTGELIGARAEIVRQTATIQFLLTNGRKKCNGLCIQF
jgi:hypothetical protein